MPTPTWLAALLAALPAAAAAQDPPGDGVVVARASEPAAADAPATSAADALAQVALPFDLDVSTTTTYQTLSGSADDTDFLVGYLDIVLGKKLWEGAVGVLELEALGGNGPDDRVPSFGGTLFGWNGVGGSGADGNGVDQLYVAEAYVSMPLFDPALTFTFGKLASTSYLDTNRAANDQTTQFLSGDFTNSAALQVPYRAAGLAFSWLAGEHVGVDVVAMRPDNSGADATSHVFAGGQVGLHYLCLGEEGNCNTYGWVSGDRNDQLGLGLSLDQDVRGNATAFARAAWQEEEADFPDTLARAWSAGVEWRGPFRAPEEDALGLAFGENTSHDASLETERVYEVYFRHVVNEHLQTSLHLQGRDHPAGDPAEGQVMAVGVRLQLYL